MKNPDQENSEFVSGVKRQLDQSVEDLSPDITARLRKARRNALDSPSIRMPWLRPAWGLAAAVATGLALMVFWLEQPVESFIPVLEDVELLASSDSLEFYEDLDFYYWLTEHEQTS